ncbi:Crp/Fnr family transcriptional regulator [Sphingomonas sp.]|uniref:Crp/Fnr family transcriptional regulator n=1 Tax=Sphingomonas sp. TaxID=28214 RepID=UPI002E303514|nr:Crp/Fnr family transcriptional regulator [Sphingomonas sp.]HEX4695155.1 Crp/Fnr family transcriptional regulator [Sphingomonas sp.]
MIQKLELRSSLSPEDRAALLALPHSVRRFEPGGWIVREGETSRSCQLILSGFVCRHKIVSDGGRQIVSVHTRGDLVDLEGALLSHADHSIQALGSVEAAVISHAELLSLAFSRPAVGRALWTDTLVDASIHREWVANVGRRDARSRLAHLLCEQAVLQQAAEIGTPIEFHLPLTQEQIADATGLTGVHVNRVLRSLSEEGLIERQKKSITIADWQSLASVAGFSDDYLHIQPEEAVRSRKSVQERASNAE